ncbi:hypothetical protein [Moorena sp. SIO4G3]|uniref:hypothetical protein n=1 Tax=Moorena sp. SIO4G3 TaxID=2607821 RepID=UPI00142CFA89|nr:hypothetical protein [Moorena sp. SIO4G3]NEO80784.1 hypothetical protein [Moorena sp. SIO4G3]
MATLREWPRYLRCLCAMGKLLEVLWNKRCSAVLGRSRHLNLLMVLEMTVRQCGLRGSHGAGERCSADLRGFPP